MHATATTTVAAPASRVWEVLSDYEGMSSWAPGLKITVIQPDRRSPTGSARTGASRRCRGWRRWSRRSSLSNRTSG